MDRLIGILLVGIVFVFGILLGALFSIIGFSGQGLTGEVVSSDEFVYTRAICNELNQCIDVIISCSQGKVVELEPVGEVKQFSDDWTDPRGEKVEDFCK